MQSTKIISICVFSLTVLVSICSFPTRVCVCVCVCLGTPHSHPHSPVCSCSPDAEMSCVSNCRLSWCEDLASRLGLTSQMVCNCLINSVFVRFYAFRYYLFCHLQFTMQIPPSLTGKTLHSVHMSTHSHTPTQTHSHTHTQRHTSVVVHICVWDMADFSAIPEDL